MQDKISMDLLFCQSENGFSLDELVLKLADAYEQKAFSELLKMILKLVQEILIYRILHAKTNATKCCDHGHLRLNGSFDRCIRTRLGEFKMNFWRVSCSACGKIFSPLQRLIGLERYQTKTNELEKLVVEAASETNYRRAVRELARDDKLPVLFHTAHGWVCARTVMKSTFPNKLSEPLRFRLCLMEPASRTKDETAKLAKVI